MTTDKDRYEPTRDDLGVSTSRAAERIRETEAGAQHELDRPVDRNVERDVARDVEAGQTDRAALFEPAVLTEFNTRWTDIQTGFVDEPRRAVQQADALVSDVIQRIADSFSRERAQLEQQWDRGDDVSTEDLRQSLRRYRSFFSRLLTL